MSDTHDLDTAAARVESLTTKTVALTAAATTFAKTMTQAFSSASAGGQTFDNVLKSLATKMMSLGRTPGTNLGTGLQGIVSGLIGNAGNVKPFADGGIIGTPSYFPIAGGTGLAGEAGPEAIMPLRRAADGSLGVAAQGGGNVIHVQIATPDAESFRRSDSYVTGQIARAVARGRRGL